MCVNSIVYGRRALSAARALFPDPRPPLDRFTRFVSRVRNRRRVRALHPAPRRNPPPPIARCLPAAAAARYEARSVARATETSERARYAAATILARTHALASGVNVGVRGARLGPWWRSHTTVTPLPPAEGGERGPHPSVHRTNTRRIVTRVEGGKSYRPPPSSSSGAPSVDFSLSFFPSSSDIIQYLSQS